MATALKESVSSFILQNTQTDGVLTPHILRVARVTSRSWPLTALPALPLPLEATNGIMVKGVM